MTLPRFIPWTLTGNFPAGANPWNGQPLAVVPAYSYFTPGPGAIPTAEELNYIFGNTLAAVGLIAGLGPKNWHGIATQTTVLGSGFTINGVGYDPANNVWLACGDDGTNASVSYVADGAATSWVSLTTVVGRRPKLIGVHGTNGKMILGNLDGTFYTVTSAGVATIVSAGTYSVIANTLGGTAFWLPTASDIVSIFLTSGVGAQAVYSPDATTVNSVTAIPASFLTTTNNISYFTSAVKSDGLSAIVGFGGTTPISNPSFLWKVAYPGSVVTVTDVTVPTGITNSSITGVAWNDSLQLWGVLVNNGQGTLWTSPDLITWTNTHSFGAACKGLATVGGYWVVNESFPYAGVTVTRIAFSPDGATWGYADSPGVNAPTLTQLATSGGQLLTFGASGAAVSFRV